MVFKVITNEVVIYTEYTPMSMYFLPVFYLKKRLEKCNQDILDYVEEFRDFSKMVQSRLAGLNSYKAEVKSEVENLLRRIERAQRDIDYLGSAKDSNICIEVHEDLVKQQLLEEAEEKKKLRLIFNASKNSLLSRCARAKPLASAHLLIQGKQIFTGSVNTTDNCMGVCLCKY